LAWRVEKIARAADFAGLLAWRQFRPRVEGPVPGLPAALPIAVESDPYKEDREE